MSEKTAGKKINMANIQDIQPQAEPYIVKSHDIHIDADYADWIADIKSRYLFYVENMRKLKRLVSVNDAEKMHQVGAELMRLKLQQVVGELQFAVNQGVIKLHQVGGDIQRLISKFNNKIEMAFLLLFKFKSCYTLVKSGAKYMVIEKPKK
ncbi:MAG: hypothetical protein E7069_07685 [Bacteroidales bacterium]|nr:hypothetical protein [Bacteroidales bacterium]